MATDLRKILFIRFSVHAFRECSSICACASFLFDFEGGMWGLIVLVPDHCLSLYFTLSLSHSIAKWIKRLPDQSQFLLLQNFSVAISVSPHVCFILVLILISMFLS